MSGCDCIEKMNADLDEQIHCILPTTWPRAGKVSRVAIELVPMPVSGPKKAPFIVANCCPFCGEKYPEEKKP